MAQLSPFATAGPDEILLPAKPWFVLFTILCGLVANAMPVSGSALLLKPDFLALILLYWCIQEPRLIGVGIAWCVGLLMDVTDATVFGQHALAYAVLAYAAFVQGAGSSLGLQIFQFLYALIAFWALFAIVAVYYRVRSVGEAWAFFATLIGIAASVGTMAAAMYEVANLRQTAPLVGA